MNNGFKLKDSRFRKKFLTVRVMRQRHVLPRAVVDVHPWFKAGLDESLSNVVSGKCPYLWQRDWN